MEFEKLVEKKFGDEFKFLKLLECIYDKSANLCTFVFMYPENCDFNDDSQKNKFISFIREIVRINSKIEVKFKKSYLDESLIINSILNFFEQSHPSVFTEISSNDIEIIKDEGIIVNLNIPYKLSKYIDNNLHNELKMYLEGQYFSLFSISNAEKEDSEEDLKNLHNRVQKLQEEINSANFDKVKRYNVNLLENISGREFAPKPEYIGEIKGLKTSIIISGIVTNLNKRSFIAKRGRNKGEEKYYLTFNLNDGTGNINCIYFISKTAEKKAFTICEGSHLAVLGDMQKGFNNKITLNVKSSYFCIKLPDEDLKQEEEIQSDNLEARTYKYIFPTKYVEYEQHDLFTVPKKYDDYILKNTFVVYDIETTGLDHNNCDITEIGAVKIEKGVITEIFQTLIKPRHLIPEEVINLTKITNEMVENCRYGEDVINDFYIFCKGSILSGYNVINFDQKFINKLGERAKLVFDNEIIDVMKVAQQKLSLKNYKLATVVKNLNISLVDAHRALNDAIATAKTLLKFYEIS